MGSRDAGNNNGEGKYAVICRGWGEGASGGGGTGASFYPGVEWCVLEDHMNVAGENTHGLGFMRWDIGLFLKDFWGPVRGQGRKRGAEVICGVVLSFIQLFKVYRIQEIFIEPYHVLCPDTQVRLIR